jgi:uncharacterized ferritin-like protein (DUF455 family)
MAWAFRNKSWSPIPDFDGMTLARTACDILNTPQAADKARLTHEVAAAWRAGDFQDIGQNTGQAMGRSQPPLRPPRAARPALKPPRDMPRRRINKGTAGRIALLHAIAHIELNAIDLAWDIIARFTDEGLPIAFYNDWVGVAEQEAKHFQLLSERLAGLDASYGDLPAHGGLWDAAEQTCDDVLARLAIAPLLLEARGLDVTPGMIAKLESVDDDASAAVLKIIYRDEIGHVAIGMRWFLWVVEQRGLAPKSTYQDLVKRHFKGLVKPPFNTDARNAAKFPADWYEPLALK